MRKGKAVNMLGGGLNEGMVLSDGGYLLGHFMLQLGYEIDLIGPDK